MPMLPCTCQPVGTAITVAGMPLKDASVSVTVVNSWLSVLVVADARRSRLFDDSCDVVCPSALLVRDWQPATVARKQNAAIRVGAAVAVRSVFIRVVSL